MQSAREGHGLSLVVIFHERDSHDGKTQGHMGDRAVYHSVNKDFDSNAMKTG